MTKTRDKYVPVRMQNLINNSAWRAFELMFIGLLHQNKCCLNYLICQLSGFLFPFYNQWKFNLRSQTGKGILILSNVLHSEIPLSQVNAVADAVVPVGGAPTLPGYQRFRQISKKLHEIEKILVRRGERGLAPGPPPRSATGKKLTNGSLPLDQPSVFCPNPPSQLL